MKKVMALLLFITVLVIVLSACQSNEGADDINAIQGVNVPPTEELTNSVRANNDINAANIEGAKQAVDAVNIKTVPSSDKYTLVWVVYPTLEYDFIYHCCFFSTGDHSGEIIDSVTGLIIENPLGLVGGHGPIGRGWVYDPELSLLGFGGIGDYSGMALLPIDGWADLFAQWGGQYRLMMVQLVDSSIRDVTELGSEFLSDDAHSGKFAVMYNLMFVTDFIFDGGSVLGGAVIEYDTIPMHIGNSWGLIDKNGNEAIPFLFEHIVRIDNDTAFARYNGRYGILNIPFTIANFLDG